MIDHDRLFKELITTFFAEFVELFFPDVNAYLDRDSLVFLDKEVFTDVTEGERHEADVIVQAKFRGQDAFFLIHVEHQSYAQAEFARRMFKYWARLFEKYNIPVYPIVLYSFDAPKTKQPDLFEVKFPGFTPVRFEYKVIQLNRLRWRDFLRNDNPIATALMSKMQVAERDRPRVKFECLRLLTTLRLNPAKMQMISGFVDIYLRLTTFEEKIFRVQVQEAELKEREEVMEIVTSWQEQGRLEEAHRIVQRLLTRKFGELPAKLSRKIAKMPQTQVEQLAEDLLDFPDRAALEAYLQQAGNN